ncbi:hypothetical protein CDL60_19375 [Roseateles noduli]|nr:hypothetical protein CDL60_19375 [Roseateles noduli]
MRIQEGQEFVVISKPRAIRTRLKRHVFLARMPDRIDATGLEAMKRLIAQAMHEMSISAKEFERNPS